MATGDKTIIASKSYVDTGLGSKQDVVTGVTSTEIGYLDGVTSAIQTQLNTKQDTLVSGTNIKTINGTTLLGSGDMIVGANADYQEFTTSGTWTKPAGCSFIYIEAFGAGGGGGGGGSVAGYRGGGGGGGGAICKALLDATISASTLSITIGAGGAGANYDGTGSNGGSTVVGTYITAGGGKGGTPAVAYNAGLPSQTNTTGVYALVKNCVARENGANCAQSNANVTVHGNSGFGGAGGGGGQLEAYLGGNGGLIGSITSGSGVVSPSINIAGVDASAYSNSGGSGGSGAFRGGNGDFGCGGGGAGSSSASTHSGTGGTGGNGVVRIWAW